MKKWLKILSFNLLVLLLIVCVLYGAVALYGFGKIKKERHMLKEGEREGLLYDQELAYKLKPDYKFTWAAFSKKDRDTVLTITTDSVGRRKVGHHADAQDHLIFFGCSYTFGDGLSDEQCIPYLMNEMDSARQCYNYALSGYGTQQMLILTEKELASQVTEEHGTAIYLFIDHHKDRASYSTFAMKWAYDFRCYRMEEGKLVSTGSFFESKPVRVSFWKGIGELNLWIKFMPLLERTGMIDLSVRDEEKYMLVTSIIAEAKRKYIRQFPQGRFLTLIFPGESENLIPYLQEAGLEYADLSSSIDLQAIDGLQADGYHPNAKGSASIANILHEALR